MLAFLNFIMRTFGGGAKDRLEDEETLTKAAIGKNRLVWEIPSLSDRLLSALNGDRELKHTQMWGSILEAPMAILK